MYPCSIMLHLHQSSLNNLQIKTAMETSRYARVTELDFPEYPHIILGIGNLHDKHSLSPPSYAEEKPAIQLPQSSNDALKSFERKAFDHARLNTLRLS